MNKTVSILGATGSVGTQALDVVRQRGYRVELLTSNNNVSAMESAARELLPTAIAMSDECAARDLKSRLADTAIRIYSGAEGINEAIAQAKSHTVINAIIGAAGLSPTIAAIDSGHTLALANKESLVIAGDIIMSRAKTSGCRIIPVDSEHSAIFQSLKSGAHSEIKRLLLTASGGPFFGKSREDLNLVTAADALAHPTWRMGRKITVDSATLMNKGFEIIEATHLFGVNQDKIDVVIHRESILHSAVEYIDNTVIAELSAPDMRSCIQYAVDYPERHLSTCKPLDLFSVGSLTFAKPDTDAFPLLNLARRAADEGGATGAVLNGSDEVAVAAFLDGRIGFTEIDQAIFYAYDRLSDAKAETSLEGILEYDAYARRLVAERIANSNPK